MSSIKQKKVKVFCTHCGADNSINIDADYIMDYGSISGSQICWYCNMLFRWGVKKKDL